MIIMMLICMIILMKMTRAPKKILLNTVVGNAIKLSNKEQKKKYFQEFTIFFLNFI